MENIDSRTNRLNLWGAKQIRVLYNPSFGLNSGIYLGKLEVYNLENTNNVHLSK